MIAGSGAKGKNRCGSQNSMILDNLKMGRHVLHYPGSLGASGWGIWHEMNLRSLNVLSRFILLSFHQTDFKCGNGYCLENSMRCNGVDDCGNGDDERNCDPNCPRVSQASITNELSWLIRLIVS